MLGAGAGNSVPCLNQSLEGWWRKHSMPIPTEGGLKFDNFTSSGMSLFKY